jgi:phosphoglycerol transferase MdoB-like AlkP superfamily enzyme
MKEKKVYSDKEVEEIQNLAGAGKSIPGEIRKISKLKDRNLIFILPLYLEIASHLIVYRNYSFSGFVYSILMAVITGLMLGMICSLFGKVVNAILTYVISGLLSVYYIAQVIYYSVFGVFMSLFTALNVGTDVLQFREMITKAIVINISNILILLVPMAVMIILQVKHVTDFNRSNVKRNVSRIIAAICLSILFIIIIFPTKGKENSAYELIYTEYNPDSGVPMLGMLVYLKNDVVETFSYMSGIEIGKKGTEDFVAAKYIPTLTPTATLALLPKNTPTSVPTPAPTRAPQYTATPTPTATNTPTPVDRSPQILDIDFGSLANSTKNKEIKWVHQYFASEIPSNKNEFTGMFKDYNLIFITAEAWSPLAVSEEKTPTLYKMLNSGFVFNNFYNPIWFTSTVDGEFAGISGLLPEGKFNGRRCARVIDDPNTSEDESKAIGAKQEDNAMPYSLGNIFKNNGYKTYAYHNHTFNYYSRNAILSDFGYDVYRGYNGGTVFGETKKEFGIPITYIWPESDLEMMEITVPEYLEEWKRTGEPFHTYYMSVSGHTNYSKGGNAMSRRHFNEMDDLSWSDTLKCYIAANYELELAVNRLIEQLKEAGALEKTVIVINADHYPYGLESMTQDQKDENGNPLPTNYYFSEFYGHEVDDHIEKYKNNLVIWNAGMTETYEIDKVACPMDILPTILNLFGIKFDSRLLMGRDILSDTPGFVVFGSDDKYKFMTDTCIRYYDYKLGHAVVKELTDEKVSDDYINAMLQEAKNRYTASKYIINNDYFKTIMQYLK